MIVFCLVQTYEGAATGGITRVKKPAFILPDFSVYFTKPLLAPVLSSMFMSSVKVFAGLIPQLLHALYESGR